MILRDIPRLRRVGHRVALLRSYSLEIGLSESTRVPPVRRDLL